MSRLSTEEFTALYPDVKLSSYIGQKFGCWTILELTDHFYGNKQQESRRYYMCKCECGIIKRMPLYILKNKLSPFCESCVQITHGCLKGGNVHYIYNIWKDIKKRCFVPTHKQYKNYGARGISIYPPWLRVSVFIEDVITLIGHRPSFAHQLDRINNDGNYEPGNIRWVSCAINTQNIWRLEYTEKIISIFARTVHTWRNISLVEYWSNFNRLPEIKISTHGGVKGRTQYIVNNAYLAITILQTRYLVHRLVYSLFTNAQESFGSILHLNDNPQDNRIWNLIEGTPKENVHMKAYNYKRRTENLPHLWWLPESQRKELMPVEL